MRILLTHSSKKHSFYFRAAVDDLEQTIKNDEADLEKKRIEEQELQAKLPEIETKMAEAMGEEAAAKEEVESRKIKYRQNSAKLSRTMKEGDILRKDEARTVSDKVRNEMR